MKDLLHKVLKVNHIVMSFFQDTSTIHRHQLFYVKFYITEIARKDIKPRTIKIVQTVIYIEMFQ